MPVKKTASRKAIAHQGDGFRSKAPLSDSVGPADLIDIAKKEVLNVHADICFGLKIHGSVDMPASIRKEGERLFDRKIRCFSALCGYLSLDPNAIFPTLTDNMAGELTKGKMNFGMFMNLSRAEVPAMLRVLEDAKKIQFPQSNRSAAKRAVLRFARRRAEMLESINRPKIGLGDKTIQPGRTYTIGNSHIDKDGESLVLTAPIIHGKNIRLLIDKPVSLDASPDYYSTFQTENYLLSDRARVSPLVYEVRYPTSLQALQLLFARPVVNLDMLDGDISQVTRSFVEETLKNQMQSTLGRMVHRLSFFIRGATTGEDVPDIDLDEDLDFLASRLIHEGVFPGVCRSVSTLSAAFVKALGFEARVVDGYLIHPDGDWGWHRWSEFSSPGSGLWLPFDPSGGALFTYPKSPLYFGETGLPVSAAPFKMSVSYF